MNYYDINGVPVSTLEWTKMLKDMDYRRIGLDTFDGWIISTVWLGLDHHFGNGPPLIFETMVFKKGVSVGEPDYTNRYSTLEEAKQGQAYTVEAYKSLVRRQKMVNDQGDVT